jgi:hypothetical protein
MDGEETSHSTYRILLWSGLLALQRLSLSAILSHHCVGDDFKFCFRNVIALALGDYATFVDFWALACAVLELVMYLRHRYCDIFVLDVTVTTSFVK